MAKAFIAIDLNKKVHEFSAKGIDNLKRLHKAQGVNGWQYGEKEKLDELKSKIVTPQDASKLLEENEILKAKLKELEENKVAKEPKKS